MKTAATLFSLLALATSAIAEIRPATVFASHMVLQRDKPVPVWGFGDAGEEAKVFFAGQSKTATTGDDGRWRVTLDAMPASAEGRELKINSHTISDVLVGEVWICSGQSNMAWTVNRSRDPDMEAAAASFPAIRHLKLSTKTAADPKQDCEATWSVCSPETVGDFTATGYFFGRELHRALGVPVGLLNTSWGGTRSEAWTSKQALESMAAAKPILAEWGAAQAAYDPAKAKADYEQKLAQWKQASEKAKQDGKKAPRRPGLMGEPRLSRHAPSAIHNAMISPLVGYAIRGAIWYQGESNSGRAYQYREIFPGMISDWRKQWGEDFPFHFVQLAQYKAPQTEPGSKEGWIELQEAQFMTLKALPNTGMACINDIGEAKDIHPKNKQDVGKRLARWSLHHDYGMKNITPSGPLFESSETNGNKVTVSFRFAEGLQTRDKGEIGGFEIAGEDKKFVWAKAKILKDGKVEVWADGIAEPKSVRYAWAANPVSANLINKALLPTSVFRTDDWPETTIESVNPGVRF